MNNLATSNDSTAPKRLMLSDWLVIFLIGLGSSGSFLSWKINESLIWYLSAPGAAKLYDTLALSSSVESDEDVTIFSSILNEI